MTVNEAAHVLADIPEIAAVEVASLKPGNVIVISAQRRVSSESAGRIYALLKTIWPNNKVIVIEEGITMKVVQS